MGLSTLKIPTRINQITPLIRSIGGSKDYQLEDKAHDLLGDTDLRLDLLYRVGLKASSNQDVSKLVDDMVRMSRQVLGAEASYPPILHPHIL